MTLPASRASWSSAGDTSFYDARDGRPDSRFSVTTADEYYDTMERLDEVETPDDLERAHRAAVGGFANPAYRHDREEFRPAARAKKKKETRETRETKEQRRLRLRLAAETNVDSTTAAEETDDDDFGFRFRPTIPPPRPLMSPDASEQLWQQPNGSLTLDDTLRMKRSRAEQTAGILLETNIDLEMDDNSSIPSSYFPQQPTSAPASASAPAPVVASFTFNTAVREAEEREASDATDRSSGTAVAADEVPRMATLSSASAASPSVTVIENRRSPKVLSSALGHSAGRMHARLDTDFELDSDAVDYRETSPQNLAILHFSRSLELRRQQQQQQQLGVAGNYVFAQPPSSQTATSVPDFLHFAGRPDSTVGSVGLRAKSMNTLTSSRTSLRSGRALLTPGRARQQSLRRSRGNLNGSVGNLNGSVGNLNGSVGSFNEAPGGGSGFLPASSSMALAPPSSKSVDRSGRLRDLCCPDVSRKKLVRRLAIVALVVCCFLLAGAIVYIVLAASGRA